MDIEVVLAKMVGLAKGKELEKVVEVKKMLVVILVERQLEVVEFRKVVDMEVASVKVVGLTKE